MASEQDLKIKQLEVEIKRLKQDARRSDKARSELLNETIKQCKEIDKLETLLKCKGREQIDKMTRTELVKKICSLIAIEERQNELLEIQDEFARLLYEQMVVNKELKEELARQVNNGLVVFRKNYLSRLI